LSKLDPQAQAPALLAQFAGDLAHAGEWNHYTIDAAIDPQARTIAGRMQLEYTNRDGATLDRLYFHLYPNLPDFAGRLTIDALTVDGAPVDVAYELRRYLLRVDLPRPLAPGQAAVVALDFTTTAPANASQDFYGAFNRENGVLSLASSYPIAAIVRSGEWDIGRPDPRGDFVNSETALYDVTLAAPADWQLVTTGIAVDGRLDGGRQVARIVSGPQRDFMIALTQLQHAGAEVDGTRINSYFRAEHAASGQAALQAAGNALRVFNKRYGPYPFAELDMVEIAARTFLGVEYPGLIEIEQNLYATGDGLEITVAHEVGHQWWYSQVGNNVQTESWLDEALASYSQIVYQEEIGGGDAAERELEGFRERYQAVLADGRDAPVSQPNTDFRGNYVRLVYGKAVLFFQAMREQIGEGAFDTFLHEHYARHRYAYITGADLLADAEDACICQLDGLYGDWITKAEPLEVP
jgi:aminopeptidase N